MGTATPSKIILVDNPESHSKALQWSPSPTAERPVQVVRRGLQLEEAARLRGPPRAQHQLCAQPEPQRQHPLRRRSQSEYIGHSIEYRVVQLNFTPEIEVFYVLFDGSLSILSIPSLKQHVKYFLFPVLNPVSECRSTRHAIWMPRIAAMYLSLCKEGLRGGLETPCDIYLPSKPFFTLVNCSVVFCSPPWKPDYIS